MNRLSALLLTAALILGGCAKDTVLQSPVESQSETEDVQEEETDKEIKETPTDSEPGEEIEEPKSDEYDYGILKYKGIEFPAIGNSVDIDFIQEGGGLNLYETSFNVAMAYVDINTEELSKYFDNDEYFERQLDSMAWKTESRLENLLWLKLYNIVLSSNEDVFIVNFHAAYDFYTDHGIDISIVMYLNDDMEWKARGVGYTP